MCLLLFFEGVNKMSNTLLFYIIIALIIALLLASFQYLYKSKNKTNTNYLLAFLRFVSFFGLFILFINPKFKKQLITTIKPKLVLLFDNSESIKNDKQATKVINLKEQFLNDQQLKNKFDLKTFTFSKDIEINELLKFDKSITSVFKSLKSTDKLFSKDIAPIILITDGNQTQGLNYTNLKSKQHIYPIIIGDTTSYQDLKITQLNVNKYAYLNHKFPVETFVVYEGNKSSLKATFTVKDGNQTVYTKNIQLGSKKNAVQLSFNLPTNSVKTHHYKATVSYLKNEKNTLNNRKNFAVEVIDEQAKILLVSSILHPDIGMLKRAIESNKQRKLIVKKPDTEINYNDYQLVIIYQPNQKYKTVFEDIKKHHKNFLIVTGTKTNWNFLNANQSYFNKEVINNTEDYIPNFNASYTTFLVKDLGFDNFAPLKDYFGDVNFSVPFESLLLQQIGSFTSENPLFATFEQNNIRGAVLLGEHSWRWRMTSYNNEKSFQPFDEFINKTVQYLSSTKRTDFLEIQHKNHFYTNDNVKVTAYLYDANYQFNDKAKLWINITNKDTKKQLKYPFALNNNAFEVNISDLDSGNYRFSVFDESKKNLKFGDFTILTYNIEQQYVGAKKEQLIKLANNNNGKTFYTNEYESLKKELIENKKFVSIQKSKEKITPLIDWKWLLAIIALSLSAEWFIRKYKGFL